MNGQVLRMKTAVSLDDDLLQQADGAARRLGAAAIADFRQKQQQVTLRQLNGVYAVGVTPEEKRVLKGIKSKARKIAER